MKATKQREATPGEELSRLRSALGAERGPRAVLLRGDERYFRTGDLASVDKEGYFFMRDRLKRMVNVSGFKVWPAEVENTLYEHPAVHEACVIAVPDAKSGESVLALLVLKLDAPAQLREQDIIDWSRERMAVYKAPRSVRFVPALPKSGTGKILWRQLQEQEIERISAAPHEETPCASP